MSFINPFLLVCMCEVCVLCYNKSLCFLCAFFFGSKVECLWGGKKVGDTVVAGFDVAIVFVIAMHNTISLPMPAPGLLPYA